MKDRVIFYSYDKLIFAWLLVVLGPLLWILLGIGVPDAVCGWVFVLVVTLVVLTLGLDIKRNEALGIILISVAVVAVAVALGAYGVPVFHWLWEFVKWVSPHLSPHLGLALSLVISPFYFGRIVWRRLTHKWTATYNEWTHDSWMEASVVYTRELMTFHLERNDMLEAFLLDGGTIVMRSREDNRVIARIENVIFVHSIFQALDIILESDREVEVPPKP